MTTDVIVDAWVLIALALAPPIAAFIGVILTNRNQRKVANEEREDLHARRMNGEATQILGRIVYYAVWFNPKEWLGDDHMPAHAMGWDAWSTAMAAESLQLDVKVGASHPQESVRNQARDIGRDVSSLFWDYGMMLTSWNAIIDTPPTDRPLTPDSQDSPSGDPFPSTGSYEKATARFRESLDDLGSATRSLGDLDVTQALEAGYAVLRNLEETLESSGKHQANLMNRCHNLIDEIHQ